MEKVWILTHGTGADGDELSIQAVYASRTSAEEAKVIDANFTAEIEEWEVKE
jgi:hypothetical protein